MTEYNLDLSTDAQTVKFHAEFGFALSRYAVLVHGNGNRGLYHLDGLDKVDSMLEWLHNGKVITQNLEWFKGSNENKLKSLAWLDGVNVAVKTPLHSRPNKTKIDLLETIPRVNAFNGRELTKQDKIIITGLIADYLERKERGMELLNEKRP